MSYPYVSKADMLGTWEVAGPAVDAILAAGTNRGQQMFDALAPFGVDNTTPPLTLAQMAQTYTLDAAAVDVVLQQAGPRAYPFMTAFCALADPVVIAPDPEGVIAPILGGFTFSGRFSADRSWLVTVTATDPQGDVDTHTLEWTATGTALKAAAAAREALNALPHLQVTGTGATIRYEAADPDYQVTVTIARA